MVDAFFMKDLIPNGKGGFYVRRFAGETLQDVQRTRDELMSEGWADAIAEEYDNFLSASEAVGEIVGNIAEWARIEGLDDEQKQAIRGAVQGNWKVTKVQTDSAPE